MARCAHPAIDQTIIKLNINIKSVHFVGSYKYRWAPVSADSASAIRGVSIRGFSYPRLAAARNLEN